MVQVDLHLCYSHMAKTGFLITWLISCLAFLAGCGIHLYRFLINAVPSTLYGSVPFVCTTPIEFNQFSSCFLCFQVSHLFQAQILSKLTSSVHLECVQFYTNEQTHEIMALTTQATSEGSGEPAHLCSLTTAFAVCIHQVWK